jgi:proline iminopeptidase
MRTQITAWTWWLRAAVAVTALCGLPCTGYAQTGPGDSAAPQLPGVGGLRVREGYLRGAGGVRLRFRLVGAERGRDTVVFVHGGPGSGMSNGFDFEELAARGHALLMYDQRGSGLSELVSDPPALTVEAHAEDLEAVRRHFRLGLLAAIGVSWGSAVVARWAALHPQHTGRLVFQSPMPPTAEYMRRRLAHLDSLRDPGATARARAATEAWATAPDSALRGLCRASRANDDLYVVGGPGTRRQRGDPCGYAPSVLRNQMVVQRVGFASLGAAFDLRPTLGRIRTPALVVEGAESNVPLDATREWARALPDAWLLLVAGAGHRTWLDQPAALFDALDAFLRRDVPPGAKRCRAAACD